MRKKYNPGGSNPICTHADVKDCQDVELILDGFILGRTGAMLASVAFAFASGLCPWFGSGLRKGIGS